MLIVWVTLQKTNRKIIFSLAPVVHNLSHYYITNKSLPLFLGDRKICKKKKKLKVHIQKANRTPTDSLTKDKRRHHYLYSQTHRTLIRGMRHRNGKQGRGELSKTVNNTQL